MCSVGFLIHKKTVMTDLLCIPLHSILSRFYTFWYRIHFLKHESTRTFWIIEYQIQYWHFAQPLKQNGKFIVAMSQSGCRSDWAVDWRASSNLDRVSDCNHLLSETHIEFFGQAFSACPTYGYNLLGSNFFSLVFIKVSSLGSFRFQFSFSC